MAKDGDRSAMVDMTMMDYFAEARSLRLRKEKDYGSSWRALGAKGIFVRITDKVKRLQSLLWEGNVQQVLDEKVDDTALDLVNYALFLLYCLRNKMVDRDNPEA